LIEGSDLGVAEKAHEGLGGENGGPHNAIVPFRSGSY
jgi:hypothetical protein